MTRAPQERVARQYNRLAELCALRRPLTEQEQAEIVQLKDMENRRRANRKWRSQDDNRSYSVELTRQWREANPGMR
jgi:hypothetical protein